MWLRSKLKMRLSILSAATIDQLLGISFFSCVSILNIIKHRFLPLKHYIMMETSPMENSRHMIKLPRHMLRLMCITSNRDKFPAKLPVSSQNRNIRIWPVKSILKTCRVYLKSTIPFNDFNKNFIKNICKMVIKECL